ncbi:hypothetical protein G9A89_016129 [Geosiphon pyriformis]|nr:hypothetical protein G9A89_016129 [Geosiphon pyriformis]
MASAIITLPWARRSGGVPDITSELLYNTTRDLLALKSGRFEERPGGLSNRDDVTESNGINEKIIDSNKSINSFSADKTQIKFVDQVFRSGTPPAHIDTLLTIVSTQPKSEYAWEGFVMNGTLFLKGNGLDNVDLRESIVAVLELAEECLKCRSLVVCLEKNDPQLANLIRTFMYIGFETCIPNIFDHDNERFMLVGMEL